MTSSPSDDIINSHYYLFSHWFLSLTCICNTKGSINVYIAYDDLSLLSNAIISLPIATIIHLFVCFYLRISNHLNFRMSQWLGSRLMARPLRSRFEFPGSPQKKKAWWKTSEPKTRIRANKFFEHMLSVRPLHGLAPSYKFMFLKIKFFLK